MEGMEYEAVDIESEEGIEFIKKYGISSLPTLLITDDDGERIAMRSGLLGRQDIERWISENTAPEGQA